MQNTANFQIKSGDPKNHLFSKFLIILHLEHVQEWEKQQFVIVNQTIGKSGRPSPTAQSPGRLNLSCTSNRGPTQVSLCLDLK